MKKRKVLANCLIGLSLVLLIAFLFPLLTGNKWFTQSSLAIHDLDINNTKKYYDIIGRLY